MLHQIKAPQFYQGSRYRSPLSPNAKKNKFGAKNMNLATTIGEWKIAGENFVWRPSVSSGLKSLPRAA